VELSTETSTSSSYEAAAALDLSSQESKKEIAESENYVSRLAKQ
jgi:arginine/lysine/ornithine decarboxylase